MVGSLHGELNEEEQARLKLWLEESNKNREEFEELRILREQAKEARETRVFDAESALRAVKRRKKERAWRVMLKYAGAVALLLGAGGWFYAWQQKNHREAPRAFERIALPGHERAWLRQGDGVAIALEGVPADTLISSYGGVAVVINDETLVLRAEEGNGEQAEEGELNELFVPRGGEFSLVLSDGTRVWLNAETRLIFPRRFAGGERRVRLEGEAYFDVSGDARWPFIAEAAEMEVTVLGTRFNVSAYPGDASRHATVAEGRVAVRAGGRPAVELVPGEQLHLVGGEWEKREVETRAYLSWIEGRFIFKDTRLEEIARQAARWYDVEIAFEEEGLKEIRFTGGIVRGEPVKSLIEAIEATSDARFRVEGRRLVVYKI
jgi:ferric-dicitrate binding protein FerR (iron transport regulator)